MHEQRKVVVDTPENSETPLDSVQSWVTPTRLFFVRNHFPVPEINVEHWSLRIEGLVDSPREWTWKELMDLPTQTVFATVECAGNGRSFLTPPAHGVQWGAGAVGHAEWTGIPLHVLLEKSGVKSGALEVMFEGADQGTEGSNPEVIHFARSLPLEKSLSPEVLLAWRMNGELLEPEHGYPLRLFVPGWYGVASVKWLTRIEVREEPFTGYYQTKKYTINRETSEGTETVSVGPMSVKSEILKPTPGETLGIGLNRIFGVAWAGERAVEKVEVSTDDGQTWLDANLIGPRASTSWTLWEHLWEVAEEGDYVLRSRAVAEDGQTQPEEHDPLLGGYHVNFVRPCEVKVLSTHRSLDRAGDAQTLLYDMNAYAEENVKRPLDVEMVFIGGEGI